MPPNEPAQKNKKLLRRRSLRQISGLFCLPVLLACGGGSGEGRSPTALPTALGSYTATFVRYGNNNATVRGIAFASWSGGGGHPVSVSNNQVTLNGVPTDKPVTYTLGSETDQVRRMASSTWTDTSSGRVVSTYPSDPAVLAFVNQEVALFSSIGGRAVADQDVFTRSDVQTIKTKFLESEECFGLSAIKVIRGDIAEAEKATFIITGGSANDWDGVVMHLVPSSAGLNGSRLQRARAAGIRGVYPGGLTSGQACSRVERAGAMVLNSCLADGCP